MLGVSEADLQPQVGSASAEALGALGEAGMEVANWLLGKLVRDPETLPFSHLRVARSVWNGLE